MFDLSPLTIFWLPSLSDPKAAAIESQEMEEPEDRVGVYLLIAWHPDCKSNLKIVPPYRWGTGMSPAYRTGV